MHTHTHTYTYILHTNTHTHTHTHTHIILDMLHESQIALSSEASIHRMRSTLLRPIARDREMGATLRAEAFGQGGGGDEEDGGRGCMSLGDLGKRRGADASALVFDASALVSRGRREVALMQALVHSLYTLSFALSLSLARSLSHSFFLSLSLFLALSLSPLYRAGGVRLLSCRHWCREREREKERERNRERVLMRLFPAGDVRLLVCRHWCTLSLARSLARARARVLYLPLQHCLHESNLTSPARNKRETARARARAILHEREIESARARKRERQPERASERASKRERERERERKRKERERERERGGS